MTAFETPAFRRAFGELLAWRRDVREFRPDPVPEALVHELLQTAALAPSVGLSQPWRFVRLRSDAARADLRGNFERSNAAALAGYDGEDAALYARLKLSGLDQAPVQIAAFSDHGARAGRGLGRLTMPETVDYSVVMALHAVWLCARTHGLGVGWVSILDPAELSAALAVPQAWRLVAVLCIGHPLAPALTPELARLGWERRTSTPIEPIDR